MTDATTTRRLPRYSDAAERLVADIANSEDQGDRLLIAERALMAATNWPELDKRLDRIRLQNIDALQPALDFLRKVMDTDLQADEKAPYLNTRVAATVGIVNFLTRSTNR